MRNFLANGQVPFVKPFLGLQNVNWFSGTHFPSKLSGLGGPTTSLIFKEFLGREYQEILLRRSRHLLVSIVRRGVNFCPIAGGCSSIVSKLVLGY